MENGLQQPEDLNAAPVNDEVHLGIYEQLAAEQAAAHEAEARQAEIDQANAAAVEAGRLTGNERRLYRGIAQAAGVGELPQGVSEDDLRSVRTINSNPVTAAANFAALQEQASARLEADKQYRDAQRAERRRIQQEERRAERTAEKQRKDDAMRDDANAENERFDAVAAEAARVHDEVRTRAHAEKLASIDERVEAGLTRHTNLSEQSRGMMRSGLRDQLTRQAEPEAIAEADKAARERKEYINANGGADAIEAIRAQEAEEARLAAEEEKRQAFLDRLHNRVPVGHREAADTAEAPAEPSRFLTASDREQLRAVVRASGTAELPEGMNPEDRLSTVSVRVGRAQAAENLNRLRASAQERLNNDEDARRALIERAQDNGIGDFTDEEIAALPATVNEFMSDDDVTEYLQRMHQIRGAEPRTDGRDGRDPQGAQSFTGPRGEFADDLAYQRSLFPGEAPVPAPAAPENPGANDNEAERVAAGADSEFDPDLWGDDEPYQPGEIRRTIDPVDPGRTQRLPRIRRSLRPVRDVPFGGDISGAVPIPAAPASGRTPERGEQVAQVPLTPREQRAAERAGMGRMARIWDTATRWWPGRSRTSWENDRPVATSAPFRAVPVVARGVANLAANRALTPDEQDPDQRPAPAAPRRVAPRRPARPQRPDDNVGVDILNGL